MAGKSHTDPFPPPANPSPPPPPPPIFAPHVTHPVFFIHVNSSHFTSSADGEAQEGMEGRKRLGRAVLTARLMSSTTFQQAKRSVQTNLWSKSAAGDNVYARYNIPLPSDEQATAFKKLVESCIPSS